MIARRLMLTAGRTRPNDEEIIPPDRPLGLAASAAQSSVTLYWTYSAPEATAGFNVYRSATPNVTTSSQKMNANLMGPTENGFLDGAVTTGTTYYYKVFAMSSAGGVVYESNVEVATPRISVIPADPTSWSLRANTGFNPAALPDVAKPWHTAVKAAINADRGYGLVNQSDPPQDSRELGRKFANRLGSYLMCLRATGDRFFLDAAWALMQEARKKLVTYWWDANYWWAQPNSKNNALRSDRRLVQVQPNNGTAGYPHWIYTNNNRIDWGRDNHRLTEPQLLALVSEFAIACLRNSHLSLPSSHVRTETFQNGRFWAHGVVETTYADAYNFWSGFALMTHEKLRKAEEHRTGKSISENTYTFYSLGYTHILIQWIRANFFLAKICLDKGLTSRANAFFAEAERRVDQYDRSFHAMNAPDAANKAYIFTMDIMAPSGSMSQMLFYWMLHPSAVGMEFEGLAPLKHPSYKELRARNIGQLVMLQPTSRLSAVKDAFSGDSQGGVDRRSDTNFLITVFSGPNNRGGRKEGEDPISRNLMADYPFLEFAAGLPSSSVNRQRIMEQYNAIYNILGKPSKNYNIPAGMLACAMRMADQDSLTAPTNLTKVSTGVNQAVVSWGAVAGAGQYEVYQKPTDSHYIYSTPKYTIVTGTQATMTQLISNLEYDVKVRALATGATPGPWSSIISVTAVETGRTQDKPPAPANLATTVQADKSVVCTWTQNPKNLSTSSTFRLAKGSTTLWYTHVFVEIGAFTIPPLASGTWELRLEAWNKYGTGVSQNNISSDPVIRTVVVP